MSTTNNNTPDFLDVLASPLMRAEEVADLLAVPVSTIYELSRRRRDPLESAAASASTAAPSRAGSRRTHLAQLRGGGQ